MLLDLELMLLQLLEEVVLEALVSGELSPIVILDTSLALDHDFGALTLDMLEQLRPGHVLKVLVVADVATELGALVHCMLL